MCTEQTRLVVQANFSSISVPRSVYDARSNAAGLLVSVEDLAHTSVRDLQFATDLAWSHAVTGQLDDLMTNGDR